jgi:hypothetical protein
MFNVFISGKDITINLEGIDGKDDITYACYQKNKHNKIFIFHMNIRFIEVQKRSKKEEDGKKVP